ncbi:glutamine amidotransferase domain-containing protein [Ditylenchus destructor]|nr:glutamine amidotransferase domain-containing protein [Ditylenchus destructor]
MCGIVGLIVSENHEPGNPAILAVDALTALQHRGTESSGLVSSDGILGTHFEITKGSGLVRDVYTDENLTKFKDAVALIGHNRYSTAGMKNSVINCIQPFVLHTTVGLIAIAHNGELVNAHRKRVLREGVGLSTDTDSELVGQIIAKTIAQNMKCREKTTTPYGDISRELSATMSAMDLSYALLVMTYDRLYALRDPYGNRPLCIGKVYINQPEVNQPALHNGVSGKHVEKQLYGYLAASESCAFPAGTEFLCEVEPGEMVEISRQGVKSIWQMVAKPPAFCIFEYVYFSRADSHLEGQLVHLVREECGRILAEESHVDADIVSTVPDSATAATIGYAQKSGIQYRAVLQRNSYVGRSFIQPSTQLRQSSVLKKFGVLSENVRDKRIILVDDSIVRGNTMGIIVRLLRQYGAKEIHLRIASPPLRYACYMGINIPSQKELIACGRTIEEIAEKLQADSVEYLSVEGLKRAVVSVKENGRARGHCTACLTGEYPIPVEI